MEIQSLNSKINHGLSVVRCMHTLHDFPIYTPNLALLSVGVDSAITNLAHILKFDSYQYKDIDSPLSSPYGLRSSFPGLHGHTTYNPMCSDQVRIATFELIYLYEWRFTP